MNSIFKPYLRHLVLVVFDDILIYSKDWTSHLTHLQNVFYILMQHRLYVKLNKCDFETINVEYLGNVIVVSMYENKITCVVN